MLGLGRLLGTPHPLTAFLTQHCHKGSQFPLFLKGPKTGHGQYRRHPLGFLKPPWSSLPGSILLCTLWSGVRVS